MQRARSKEAKEDRRDALLSAALDEFFERGFSAARMDDIASRAGVSKGTVYLYFDSKEALFAALIDTVAVPNVERLEAAIASSANVSMALKVMMGMAPLLVRESRVPMIAKVMISDASAFPAQVSGYRKKVIERVLAAIAQMLSRAKDAGEIDLEFDDPKLAARLVVAPMILSAIWRIVFEHDKDAVVDLNALFALHGKMLARALGVKEAA